MYVVFLYNKDINDIFCLCAYFSTFQFVFLSVCILLFLSLFVTVFPTSFIFNQHFHIFARQFFPVHLKFLRPALKNCLQFSLSVQLRPKVSLFIIIGAYIPFRGKKNTLTRKENKAFQQILRLSWVKKSGKSV